MTNLADILNGVGGFVNSMRGNKPANLVTKSKIEQMKFTEVIGESGNRAYRLRERVVKETVETVFVSGDMRLTGWQTTTTYVPSNGKVVSTLKERLDKQP